MDHLRTSIQTTLKHQEIATKQMMTLVLNAGSKQEEPTAKLEESKEASEEEASEQEDPEEEASEEEAPEQETSEEEEESDE